MLKNIDIYKKDFDRLVNVGTTLQNAIKYECFPKLVKDDFEELPDFKIEYQSWYTESLVLIKQLLPDRLTDFIRYYEKPKTRNRLSVENYTIEDYLQGLQLKNGIGELLVGPSAGIPRFTQQLAILKSISTRFESSLFEITQIVQADLFNDELSSARELLKHKFIRASGAIAGVVLEKHLGNICYSHNIKITKKTPTIADYNDILKREEVLDVPNWRFIQFLGDIRNSCDHNKDIEPTEKQVKELIDGVDKIIKTIF